MYLKVLITNDDGVNSPGLWAAAQAMAQAMMEPGEIFVVAPDRDQSGVGASLTLRSPLRVREILPAVGGGGASVRAFSVEGTPGDATVLALESLVGPVDLVVSGINNGSNLGEDVLISGTVGAALQGYVRGYPSVAVSVGAVTDTPYDVAAAFLGVLSRELANGLSLPVSLMNVNVPNRPAGEIAGIRVTKLGRRSYTESVTLLEHGVGDPAGARQAALLLAFSRQEVLPGAPRKHRRVGPGEQLHLYNPHPHGADRRRVNPGNGGSVRGLLAPGAGPWELVVRGPVAGHLTFVDLADRLRWK